MSTFHERNQLALNLNLMFTKLLNVSLRHKLTSIEYVVYWNQQIHVLLTFNNNMTVLNKRTCF